MKKSLGRKALTYPTPVWCIGSFDSNEKPNITTISMGGICCSEPPFVGISIQKETYTYQNIMRTKAYTINVPSEKYSKEAYYFGRVSGKNQDKFKETGLTPIRSDLVDAPYVKEFPLIMECVLIYSIELGLCTYCISEIQDVKASENILDKNGLPDMKRIEPFVSSPGVEKYYVIGGEISRARSIGENI